MAVWLSAAAAAERPPAVAGQFYPAQAKALSEMVDAALALPAPKAEGTLVALLVPHAGLEFSGRVAAEAFAQIERGRFDSVIVVGTGHYKAVEGAALYPGGYRALGFALPYDEALAALLMKAEPLIAADPSAHEREHSIEVELPFLAKRLPKAKLVALVMNTQDLEVERRIAHALARAAKGRRVLLVASSDLSHYPNGSDDDAVDQTTLAALETLDPSYFWLANRLIMNRGVAHLEVSYCGEGAVGAVMAAAAELGATKARLLGRLNSGDVVSERDYHHVVGYAAVAFVKGPKPSKPPLTAAEKTLLLKAARGALLSAAAGKEPSAVPLSPDPAFNLPAAVFVTLKDAKKALRGCIGTLRPQESLLESVVHNAASAALRDPRFAPVAPQEVKDLRIEISVLSPSRKVAGASGIHPKDGVILAQGEHSGVFLPQVWEDLPDKTRFLEELCSQKAGLAPDCYKDPKTAFRTFSAEPFEEEDPPEPAAGRRP